MPSPAPGSEHTGEDPQQGRLAGAVLADDTERLARREIEADVVERMEGVGNATAAKEVDHELQPPGVGVELGVVLADAGKVQQRHHHTKSSKCGEQRLP